MHRLIAYDEDFRLLTMPTTHKGTAKVMPRLGVKINNLCYWSDAFLDAEVETTQVPIRFDPTDAGTAYAFVKGRWVRCISEHYTRFAGRSEREVMLATVELRRRNQRHGQQFAVTARKLADFLGSVEAEEVLLEQRLRDAEAKDVLEIMASIPTHWSNESHDGLYSGGRMLGQGVEDVYEEESALSGEADDSDDSLALCEDY
jgi:hypothetical protein